MIYALHEKLCILKPMPDIYLKKLWSISIYKYLNANILGQFKTIHSAKQNTLFTITYPIYPCKNNYHMNIDKFVNVTEETRYADIIHSQSLTSGQVHTLEIVSIEKATIFMSMCNFKRAKMW